MLAESCTLGAVWVDFGAVGEAARELGQIATFSGLLEMEKDSR
jgi:hypothetical protein